MKKEKTAKDYLEKTFLEELNYKIWSTKGSRFNANKRLLQVAFYSNLCTSMLSVYLIAVGLLSVYNIYSPETFNENLIAFSITCLSILLLVFSQIENAKDFNSKAKEFHNCGLELSKLYNKLRIFKTLVQYPTVREKREFANEISEEYQRILEKHENHHPIDHKLLKTKSAQYHELKNYKVALIHVEYYLRTLFIYQLLIVIPPLIICYIVLSV